jgi:hypothetical protein
MSLRRDQRGVVFPSPVVILSVVSVAMAAVAFLFTQGSSPKDHDITTTSDQQSVSPSPTSSGSTSPSSTATKPAHKLPKIDRAKVYVTVFNNSHVAGLAAQVASKASDIGWQIVGTDNWYGTIPSTTVYYPPKLQRAARLLALDLGIQRTAPAVDPMRTDRLTVILTGPLS